MVNYSPELVDEVCRRLAGGESLLKISKQDGMPGYSTWFEWLERHPGMTDKYVRARATQAHCRAEMAADAWEDEPDPQKARLKFDAYRWHAGKLAPKVYGDKTMITGGDGEGPVQIEDSRRPITDLIADAPKE